MDKNIIKGGYIEIMDVSPPFTRYETAKVLDIVDYGEGIHLYIHCEDRDVKGYIYHTLAKPIPQRLAHQFSKPFKKDNNGSNEFDTKTLGHHR